MGRYGMLLPMVLMKVMVLLRFSKFQKGIDTAEDGDTVLVSPGTC